MRRGTTGRYDIRSYRGEQVRAFVPNRLIREVHSVLLSSGRGSEKSPGEFRTSQNWIGGSRPGNAVSPASH